SRSCSTCRSRTSSRGRTRSSSSPPTSRTATRRSSATSTSCSKRIEPASFSRRLALDLLVPGRREVARGFFELCDAEGADRIVHRGTERPDQCVFFRRVEEEERCYSLRIQELDDARPEERFAFERWQHLERLIDLVERDSLEWKSIELRLCNLLS